MNSRTFGVCLACMAMAFVGCGKSCGGGSGNEAKKRVDQIALLAGHYYSEPGPTGQPAAKFPGCGREEGDCPPCIPPNGNAQSVPRSIESVAGKLYQPSDSDWFSVDSPTAWQRIHFSLDIPIKYLFCYSRSGEGPDSVSMVMAVGDLDDDGIFSVYRREGRVVDGSPLFGPMSVENDGE